MRTTKLAPAAVQQRQAAPRVPAASHRLTRSNPRDHSHRPPQQQAQQRPMQPQDMQAKRQESDSALQPPQRCAAEVAVT